jgi:hypothetical protein
VTYFYDYFEAKLVPNIALEKNHTYKLEHTMFVIAIQEQYLIIAVLHLEVALRPKPFN